MQWVFAPNDQHPVSLSSDCGDGLQCSSRQAGWQQGKGMSRAVLCSRWQRQCLCCAALAFVSAAGCGVQYEAVHPFEPMYQNPHTARIMPTCYDARPVNHSAPATSCGYAAAGWCASHTQCVSCMVVGVVCACFDSSVCVTSFQHLSHSKQQCA